MKRDTPLVAQRAGASLLVVAAVSGRADGMSTHGTPLNPVQLEVLAWVAAGCAEGVYEGWSHRVTARALQSRGLVVVKGHGGDWVASLTDTGAYYLEHGVYPPTSCTRPVPGKRRATSKPAASATARTSQGSAVQGGRPKRMQTPRKQAPQKPGPLDAFMSSLAEAEQHRIVVPHHEEPRYRQLAGAAKRFGRIPDGMCIAFHYSRRDGTMEVALEDLPAWMTTVLDPVPVAQRLYDPSDVVRDLADSETFPVTGEPRQRALRLLEALVTAARQCGMTVTAQRGRAIGGYGYGRDVPRRDEIKIVVDGDEFRLWFTQKTLQKPHEPTAREFARARRGYLFPDFDEVPDQYLGITLEGKGGKFRADAWNDTEDHQLEKDLAQILEEIRLRHEKLAQQREDQLRRREQERRDWEVARERAVVKYRQRFLIDAMGSQASRWTQASELRRYADAIRARINELAVEDRERAIACATQIEARAAKIDPLADGALPPTIPDPSSQDLEPFMGSRSAYGPYRQ
jgi:hypothetical protein